MSPLPPQPSTPLPQIAQGNGVAHASPSPARTTLPPRRSHLGWWVALGGAVVVFAGVVWYATHHASPKADFRHGMGNMPIPIIAVEATKGEIGVYDNGLGTVTPFNTVTVHARVDGQITKIFFTEGQTVKAGEKLVEIDPRPYRAALDQAKGQLARDQALLENAKADLARYQTLWSQDSVSKQILDTQVATVAGDAATVQTDQANVETAQLNLNYCTVTAPTSGKVGLRQVDEGNLVHSTDSNGLLVINQVEPITVVFTISEDQLPAVLAPLHAGKTLRVDAYDRAMKTKLATGVLLSIDNQIDTATATVKIKALFDNQDGSLFPNQFVNVRLLVDTHSGVTLVPQAAIQRGPQNYFVYLVEKGKKPTAAGGKPDKDQDQEPKAPDPVTAFLSRWLPAKEKDPMMMMMGGKKPKVDGAVTVRNVTLGISEDNIPGSRGLCEITDGLAPGDLIVVDGVDKLSEGGGVIVHMQGEKKAAESAPAASAAAAATSSTP